MLQTGSDGPGITLIGKRDPGDQSKFLFGTIANLVHGVRLKLRCRDHAKQFAEAIPAEQECGPVQRNAACLKPLEVCQLPSPVTLSSIAMISGWLAASLTTLMPKRFRTATSAPRSIRSRAISASPCIAAIIKGVMPSCAEV